MYREYVLREVASELDDPLTSDFLNAIADHVVEQYDTDYVINTRNSSYIDERLSKYVPAYGSGVKRLPLDSTYYCAIRPDVRAFFESDFTDETEYVRQKYDCENFAIQAMSHAQRRGMTNVGLVIDYSGKHAYNIAVYPGPAEPDLIEPQSDGFKTLNPGDHEQFKLTDGFIVL